MMKKHGIKGRDDINKLYDAKITPTNKLTQKLHSYLDFVKMYDYYPLSPKIYPNF